MDTAFHRWNLILDVIFVFLLSEIAGCLYYTTHTELARIRSSDSAG